MSLVAWTVVAGSGDSDPDFVISDVIYAETAERAVLVAREQGSCRGLPLDEYEAERRYGADGFATEEGVEGNDERLRILGYRCEGEWTCDTCGHGALGMEKYAVCMECNQCKECGCDSECEQSEGWSFE